MNKKVVLSVVLVFAMLLSMFAMASAEGEFKLNARVTEWTEENTFDLYVSFENNPGIAGFGYAIEFDKNLIMPVAVEKLDFLNSGSTGSNLEKFSDGTNKGFRVFHLSTENFEGDGDIHKITFMVSPQATSENSAQNVEIKLAVNTNGLFYDSDLVEYVPVYGSASVVLPEIEDDRETSLPVVEDDGDDSVEYINPDGESVSVDISAESGTVESAPKTVIILTINSVNIKINNNTLINDVAPIIVNDRTMLPVRVIAEELGAEVKWDEANQKVTVTNAEREIVVYIDSDTAYVDDKVVKLDSPAFIQNDRTYLPLRFISENLGAEVDWDEDLQQVTIKK